MRENKKFAEYDSYFVEKIAFEHYNLLKAIGKL